MLNVPWLPDADNVTFPHASLALADPDGLLCIGANLGKQTLLTAYQSGIFPWFEDGQPIMWWSPSVRALIDSSSIYVSKSMGKLYRRNQYRIAVDSAFDCVIDACSAREETWITDDMCAAYGHLHDENIAHSVEVYDESDNLVGGLYGVFVGNCFCGESMFSYRPNTSKLALIALARFLQAHGCRMIDCQMPTEHLYSMGAVDMPRDAFISYLATAPENTLLTQQRWTKIWQRY